MKTSWQWLLFSKFWGQISQKWLQRIYFRAPRFFSRKIRSCCCMTKRYVKGFGQQLQNKRVREWYVPTIFRHSMVENVGPLRSEPYIYKYMCVYKVNTVKYLLYYTASILKVSRTDLQMVLYGLWPLKITILHRIQFA